MGIVESLYAQMKQLESLGIAREGPVIAYTLVCLKPVEGKSLEDVGIAKKFAELPEVEEIYVISGDYDLLLKIRAESLESLGKLVLERIRSTEGVVKTYTCLVFLKVK